MAPQLMCPHACIHTSCLPQASPVAITSTGQLKIRDNIILSPEFRSERCATRVFKSFKQQILHMRSPSGFSTTGLKLRKDKARKLMKPVDSVLNINASAVSTSVQSQVPYIKVGQCFVYPPLHSNSRSSPKALISFLGGAFIGATPDVTYRLLMELLAKEGYLVVATPYNVTFDHSASADSIHSRFNACLQLLYQNGLPAVGLTGSGVESLPIYGVGHSNGALMHVLIGSLCKEGRLPSANAIISYNNKPASDAVPYFEQLGPTLARAAPAIESFPLTGIALSLAEQLLQEVEQASAQLPSGILKEEDLEPIARFADQLIPVFAQVGQGVSEFTPTPSENRRIIASSYSVPDNLLVKFSVDSIDETDTLNALLRIRAAETGGRLRLVELPGTHATPLAPDFRWRVGDTYSPLDAIGQVVRTAALADLRRLVQTVTKWLDEL